MRKIKEKTRNEEKQDLQKVQKRENRETIKIRTKKGEKKKRRTNQAKKWYIRKITKKMFGWTSVGQVARNVEHSLPVTSHTFFVVICLLRFPTCTAALPIYLNSLNSRSLVELSILNPLSWVLVLNNL